MPVYASCCQNGMTQPAGSSTDTTGKAPGERLSSSRAGQASREGCGSAAAAVGRWSFCSRAAVCSLLMLSVGKGIGHSALLCQRRRPAHRRSARQNQSYNYLRSSKNQLSICMLRKLVCIDLSSPQITAVAIAMAFGERQGPRAGQILWYKILSDRPSK